MADAAAAPQTSSRRLSDDIVLPFRTVRSGVIGRLVRLGSSGRHDPVAPRRARPPSRRRWARPWRSPPCSARRLKFDGKLIVQTKTDGLVDFLVVNFEAPGRRARLCALRQEPPARARARGQHRPADAARQRPSRHHHRPGRGHGALSGDRGALRRGPRRSGAEPTSANPSSSPRSCASRLRATTRRAPTARRAVALAGRRPDAPESGARRRQAAGAESRTTTLARRGRRRLGAHADPGRDRRGPRAARSDAAAGAAALSAVPRGRRARLAAGAGAGLLPLLARARRGVPAHRSARWSSPTCASPTAPSASRASSAPRTIASRPTSSTEHPLHLPLIDFR